MNNKYFMQRHVITGGTGFLGKYLVQELLKEEGNEVVLIVRPQSQDKAESLLGNLTKEAQGRVRVVLGDIREEGMGIASEDRANLIETTGFFWHLAANLSFSFSKQGDVYKDNVLGTKNVVDFVNMLAKPARFLYVSTAFVCGTNRALTEEIGEVVGHGQNAYEKTKKQAEQIVADECQKAFTVFRPAIVIGDAYEGKAVGCTFGYYRFAYVFYYFKQWLAHGESSYMRSFLIRMLGVSYNQDTDKLTFKRLMLVYPRGVTIQLVPVDFVIQTMLFFQKKEEVVSVVNIAETETPKLDFLVEVLLQDLRMDGVRLKAISPRMFRLIVRLAYMIIIPWRGYLESTRKYLPYISYNYQFGLDEIAKAGLVPNKISRDFMMRINAYAKAAIFEKALITFKKDSC
jgi:nucleoside-diphosphate-sugar epimerase